MTTTVSFELDSSLIPEEWELATIGSFGEIISGNAFKSKQFVKAGVPVVKISNVQCGYYIKKNQEYLPESYMSDHKRFVINQGDLLIALTRPITNNELKICRYPFSELGLLNQRVAKISTEGSVSENYIHLFFLSRDFKLQVQSKLTETLQPNLSPKDLARLYTAFPPLAEQKVIADKLDSLLAQVETTKARLDRIPDILKRFRQSVLAAAVSGRLTEEWRESHLCDSVAKLVERFKFERSDLISKKQLKKSVGSSRDASALFDDLPSTWSWVYFEHIATYDNNALKAGPFGSALKKSDCVDTGYRVYGQEQVIAGDESLVTYYVDQEKFDQLSSCSVGVGDILVSLVGTIGKVLVLSEAVEEGIINPRLVKISLQKDISRAYIKSYLDSPVAHDFFKGFSHGGTMEILNLSILKDLPIPLPPLEEQTEIVRRVEQLFTYADTIEQQVQTATARVNNLTQSILAKAFRGELTADWRAANPDLISGDNSAAALLQKIKAERAAMKPKKKARVKKVKV